MDERLINLYDRAIKKDLIEIEADKENFIKEIKSGLGEKVNNFESYKKPTPSLYKRLTNKLRKILSAI
jgi:hypothetical protein